MRVWIDMTAPAHVLVFRPLIEIMRNISQRFDGAYCLVLLNALGEMLVARDPLGLRPLCYAVEGPLFAAASESVALLNLGFAPENIKSLLPGQAVTITASVEEIFSKSSFTVDQRRVGDAALMKHAPTDVLVLLLRMDLFCQRGQHDGRPQRLFVA